MNIIQQDTSLRYGDIDAHKARESFSRELQNFLKPFSPEEQAKKLEILNSSEELEGCVAFFGSDITKEEKHELFQFLVRDISDLSEELDSKFGAFLYQAVALQVQEMRDDFHKSMRIERVLVWVPEGVRERVRNLLVTFGLIR